MQSDAKQHRARHDHIPRKMILWLIVGRLLTIIVLVAVTVVLSSIEVFEFGRGATLIVAVVALLSVVYTSLLLWTRVPVRWQVSAQFFFDALLVTWFVWATGDLRSPYAALYIVVISIASIYLGARGALVTSVWCALLYLATMLAAIFHLFPDGAGNIAHASTAEAAQIVGLNVIAFFVVGLLAARLAERQSKSEEATHALADLRALHERIVESIRSGVVTTDLHGCIYTFNSAAEEITGYEAKTLRGQEASILFGTLDGRIEESLRAADAGEQSPRYEADCLTPEGLRIRLGFSIFPLAAKAEQASTKPSGLVITFQDLTDIRALEETSRRQDRLAAVGRVAAGIAHEVRNPLAAMSGSIQMLRSEAKPDSTEAELMDIVLNESERLNRIITDFLTYARPRGVQLAEIDLREPLRETFTLLRHSPEIMDGHELVEDFMDVPALALADEAAMKQVFWNLARNALQAMPDGGNLRAELRLAPHGKRWQITFTDTGRGMTPEQVERLFEPFTSFKSTGTGLGLSIIYQIVRDHGGTINVRSREGAGTTITVELPVKN